MEAEIYLISERHFIETSTQMYISQYYSDMEVHESVAIISIGGAIGRNRITAGEIQRNLATALRDSQVSAILLYIDSPGGEAQGIAQLAEYIYNSEKPVVVYGLEMNSGALWLASQAAYIVADASAQVGSIGAMMKYTNIQKALEMHGEEVKILRATKSKDKARINPYEPLTRGLEEIAIESLDRTLEVFISAVKKGRGMKSSEGEPFTGLIYTAEEAKSFELIDEIGTFETAFEKAKKLGESKTLLNLI